MLKPQTAKDWVEPQIVQLKRRASGLERLQHALDRETDRERKARLFNLLAEALVT